MGHCIHGFIGSKDFLTALLNVVNTTVQRESLPQNNYLIYLTEDFEEHLDERYLETPIFSENPFAFLTNSIFPFAESLPYEGPFLYIETDYFGGCGTQGAILFKNNQVCETWFCDVKKVDFPPEKTLNRPINKALQHIGVVRSQNQDEFDTVGLRKFRRMPE